MSFLIRPRRRFPVQCFLPHTANAFLYMLLFVIALSLHGCNLGPRYHAGVNAFANEERPIMPGSTYVILPGREIEMDLVFKQYARMTEMKLESLGYRKSDYQDADIAVFLDYKVDAGRIRHYTQSHQVYGQTGGGMSTVQGMNLSTGQLYTATVQTPQTYGVVGTETAMGSYTEYTRSLVVAVTDLKHYRANQTVEHLWKGEITSAGSSNDLRTIMPVLIEAGFRHFGQDTKRQVQYTLSANDDAIRKLKGEKIE